MNGKLHHYPSPDIARSWNPSWGNDIKTFTAEECAAVPKGEPLKMANPMSLPEGPISLMGRGLNKYCGVNPSSKSIECNVDATATDMSSFTLYNLGDGTHSLKSNGTNKYCRDTGESIVCDQPEPLAMEKFHVVKGSGSNEISFTGPKSGTKRRFCADEGSRIVCNRERAGQGEIFRHAPFSIVEVTPSEGASVSCDDGPAVYRYINGKLHLYPTPEIAWSWNNEWNKNIVKLSPEACTKYPKGEPMKMANPFSVPEGPLSLRGGGKGQYCGVNQSKNIQCNLEATVNTDSQFFLESLGDGTYALKNKTTNQYCTDTGTQIQCSSVQPLRHEKFHYVKGDNPNTFSLTGPKSGTKRRFCADEVNRIICNRERAGPGEMFTYDTFGIMSAPTVTTVESSSTESTPEVQPNSATQPPPAKVDNSTTTPTTSATQEEEPITSTESTPKVQPNSATQPLPSQVKTTTTSTKSTTSTSNASSAKKMQTKTSSTEEDTEEDTEETPTNGGVIALYVIGGVLWLSVVGLMIRRFSATPASKQN
jgi:hypothetical protein